jgi:hypothetical protein
MRFVDDCHVWLRHVVLQIYAVVVVVVTIRNRNELLIISVSEWNANLWLMLLFEKEKIQVNSPFELYKLTSCYCWCVRWYWLRIENKKFSLNLTNLPVVTVDVFVDAD